jgi:hypothetical protein
MRGVKHVVGAVVSVSVCLCLAAPAVADEPAPLGAAIQLDLGLAVVGLGYEHALGPRIGVMGELQIFSTYFLPQFDLGDRVDGWGAEVRGTYYVRDGGRGPYATVFARANRVTADEAATDSGGGFSIGACGGYVFGITPRLDIRVGGGAQYLHYALDTADASTPFVQLDLVVGYRL